MALLGAPVLAQPPAGKPATPPAPAAPPAAPAPPTKAAPPPAVPGKAPPPATSADPSAAAQEGATKAQAGQEPKAAGGELGPGSEAQRPSAPKEPPPAEGGVDGATYQVRLRDLQQRIDQLKEQIRRSHTRLSLLSDTILSGGSSGSRSTIRFENKLTSQFKLTRCLVTLDGAVQYNKTDRSGVLAEQKVIPIFNGSIPPGDHTVQVLINLQGYGYGVFSYLRAYKLEVRSTHSFTAVEGKTTELRILAYEKGGVTTPMEERPAVKYLEKVVAGLVDASRAK
jgi:hypothetical protein